MSTIHGPDGRKRIAFVVPRPGGGAFLQADGSWGEERTAAQFEMRVTMNQAERLQYRIKQQALAGSAFDLAGLERQEREIAELLDAETRASVPRPTVTEKGEGEDAAEVVSEMTDEQFARYVRGLRFVSDSQLGIAYRGVLDMLERIGFMALWDTSIVEAPPGLRRMSQMESLSEEVYDAIVAVVNPELDGLHMGNGQSLTS